MPNKSNCIARMLLSRRKSQPARLVLDLVTFQCFILTRTPIFYKAKQTQQPHCVNKRQNGRRVAVESVVGGG